MATTQLHISAGIDANAQDSPAKKAEVKTTIRRHGLMHTVNAYLANLSSVKTSDKVSFFRLLATMINAGIPIVKSLTILEHQIPNPHFKNIIADIADKIEEGNPFSRSLADYPKYFTQAQIGMVEAGEASGQLNETLLQIATEMEKSAALTSKIKGAMIYPVVVILILLGAGFAVMTFVMPKIKDMFDNLGGDLPQMTQVLINVSDFLVSKTMGLSNALWVLLVFTGMILLFLWWKRSAFGRPVWDFVALRIPVFGKLSKKVILARFCRGISTLTGSGLSIIKALRITAGSVGNAAYENRIHKIADDVEQGITMGENMEDDTRFFPSMVVGMISVAEKTAQIDAITGKLAGFYEEEVDDMVKNLSSIMEPLIIVVLGGAVGFLVLAVMMPILQSSDLASNVA